jgi:hypothetical protein
VAAPHAIWHADTDGSRLTEPADRSWTPFLPTPNHPEYPVRTYDKFNDIEKAITAARVYGGMHFRQSDINGARFGRKVARHMVTKNYLQKLQQIADRRGRPTPSCQADQPVVNSSRSSLMSGGLTTW